MIKIQPIPPEVMSSRIDIVFSVGFSVDMAPAAILT